MASPVTKPPVRKPISLAQAMRDPKLFGSTFSAPSFWTWHCVAKLFSGEALDPREAALFRECTGRSKLPDGPVTSLTFLSGRRSGKDRFMSALACWLAALAADWRSVMSAGEDATVILLGSDFKQARILRKYCAGLLEVPMLAALVTRATEQRIEFKNGSVLEIATNDASLVRGRSAIGILGTEVSYWPTEGSDSDEEVIAAATPSMAMTPSPGGLLMMASSVYRRDGYMFQQWKELHGNDDAEDICWLSPSATMNSMIPPKVIEKAVKKDPQKANADYLSIWRDDASDFITMEMLEAATDHGVTQRSPAPNIEYHAFCDAAGGTGGDSFSLCIAHREDDTVVIDFLHERLPRFVPEAVVAEFAAILKLYGCASITGDHYSSGWNATAWERAGIKYIFGKLTKSDLYLAALPTILSLKVRLLDSLKMRQQFVGLVRRVHPTGRESVDDRGAASSHDDLSNACAGAMVLAANASKKMNFAPPVVIRKSDPAPHLNPALSNGPGYGGGGFLAAPFFKLDNRVK
jgi:hypothetical protein